MSGTLYAYLDETDYGGEHVALFLSHAAADTYSSQLHTKSKSETKSKTAPPHGMLFPVPYTDKFVGNHQVYLVLAETGYGGADGTHRSFSTYHEASAYARMLANNGAYNAEVFLLLVR